MGAPARLIFDHVNGQKAASGRELSARSRVASGTGWEADAGAGPLLGSRNSLRVPPLTFPATACLSSFAFLTLGENSVYYLKRWN